MNIFLVEDNTGDVLLAREAMREINLPYHLEVVQDGEGAICRLSQMMEEASLTPDIVLLDLNLPGLSGLEVLSFIKNHQPWDHVPVVVFSTSEAESDIASCYQRQANCFLTKPIGFDELVGMFRQMFAFWHRQTRSCRISA
jgi:two-component system, chemotaxis family, response regulator Rcp1